MTTDRPSRIVTYAHRPKRAQRRKAQAAAIVLPRSSIVVARKPKPGRLRLRLEPEPEPEGEASVRAFFKRMMPDHPLLQDE
jgi:hypothetical protein